MPEILSVEERAIRTLIHALSQIKTTNGYNNDVHRIERTVHDAPPAASNGAVLQIYEIPLGRPYKIDGPGGSLHWDVKPIEVRFYGNQGITKRPVPVLLNSLKLDVRRAIGVRDCPGLVDITITDSNIPQRVFQIDWSGGGPAYGEGGHAGYGMVQFEIRYHYLAADPCRWDDDDLPVSENGLYMGEPSQT